MTYFILKHPATDKVVWTGDPTRASALVGSGFYLLTTSPVEPEQAR